MASTGLRPNKTKSTDPPRLSVASEKGVLAGPVELVVRPHGVLASIRSHS